MSTDRYLQLKEARTQECLLRVLSMPEGTEVLAWIMEQTGFQSIISYQDKNPEGTSFMEGRRSVGNDLCQHIGGVSPDGLENILTFMAKEKATDARNRNQQFADSGTDFPVYEYDSGEFDDEPAGEHGQPE